MLRFSCLIGAAILGWLVAPASADTIANFTLDNVTADEGFDVITGGFTLDFTTSTLSNINITTTEDIIVKLTTINDADSAFPTEWGGNFFEFAANDTSSSDFTDGDLLMIDLATVLTPSDVLGPTSIPIASGSFENINHCTVIGCGAVMFMPLTGSLTLLAYPPRHFRPRCHFSLPASARWACLVGAGSARRTAYNSQLPEGRRS